MQIIGFCILALFAAVGRYLLVSMGIQPFPNFEVVTVAAFIGIMFLDIRIAMLIPLVGMICSDILVGNPIFVGDRMNQIVIFTYSGFALISLASIFVGERIKPYVSSMNVRSVFCIAGTGALLVFMYDIWTNFGWWYIMYPHTTEALLTVYLLGVPFMIYHLISGITTFVIVALPVLSYVSNRQSEVLQETSRTKIWRQSIPAVAVASILVLVSLTGCISTLTKHEGSKEIVENVSMKIDAPTWTMSYMNVTTKNVTVADFLYECANQYNFTVKAKYYQSYDSLFIEAINGTENGDDGKYWQYYVNNEFAEVGCSDYFLSDNDVVEWQFESSAWTN